MQEINSKKSNLYGKIAIIGLLIISIGSYILIPSVKAIMDNIFLMFKSGDFTKVGEFVQSYGPYAAVISFMLMILQSIAAPLPAFLITFANASLFGWWQGAILSWTSAMAGAAVCFFIARILGRDVAVKLTSRKGLEQIDKFFVKYGKQSILIARLLPFVSFDIVSYAAGLTGMGFVTFLVATGLGQLPATIIYSYVGGMLTGGAKLMVTGLLILFALTILIFSMRQIYNDRQKKKEGFYEKNNILKISIFISIIIGVIILNNHYGWSQYLSDTRNLEFIKKLVNDNLLFAIVIYIVSTIVGCVVLAIPGVTFAVFAGIIFGPCLGIFACLFATTIGAALAFVVGRFFLKDMIKPMLEKNKTLKKLLFSDNDKSDLILLMITRLVPIFPYNLQNFAYGITDIKFWKYTIYTFVFMFPGVAFFTIGSAGLTAGKDKWKYFAIAGILAVIVTGIGMIIQKKYLGKDKK